MIDPVTNYRQGDLVQSIARDGLGRSFEVIEVGDTRYPLPLKLQLYRNDKDRAYYYKDFATVRPYDGKPIPKERNLNPTTDGQGLRINCSSRIWGLM